MVKGIEIFRSFFQDFTNNYVLIGGAACDAHMTEAGLTFRATKDLDIILVVEALNTEFVKYFWEFVKAGGYEEKQKSPRERKYYRFLNPENKEYPFQLELFARNAALRFYILKMRTANNTFFASGARAERLNRQRRNLMPSRR